MDADAPQWQGALNNNLKNNKTRQEKAMRGLNVMLSNEAQSLLSNGREQLPYSQTVDLSIADQFANLTPLAESNHMYIRIASNDFFSASRDVVQKMITMNGKPLKDEDTFIVTCLATGASFAPFLADDSRAFERGESNVKTEWTPFVTESGAVLAEPENYITLNVF